MKATNNLQGVSTFRWDTTYTTTYRVINESIRKYSSSPTEFSNHDKPVTVRKAITTGQQFPYQLIKDLLSTVSEESSVFLDGIWEQWSLDLQGNGNLICMKLPIKTGTIELPGFGKGDLSGGYIIAEIKLQIIHTGTSEKSVVLTDEEAPVMEVTIKKHSFPNIEKGSVMDLLIDGTFNEYLNTKEVMDQFEYVFSTASINDKATGDFAWLTPSDLSYAVFAPDKGATEDNSLYSMLCMTDNSVVPPDIQKSIDSEVFRGITKNANAVLCISPQKFCEHILIEASKNLITGSSESDYAYSTDGTEIYNEKEITMKNVEISEGEKVDLKIAAGNYRIRIMNDHLETFITDAFHHEDLYNVYISFNQQIGFETIKNGADTIFIPKESDYYNAVTHVTIEPTEMADILKWTGLAIEMLGMLLGLGLSVVKIAKVTSTATKVGAEAATKGMAAGAAAMGAAANGVATGVTKAISITNGLIVGSAIACLIGFFMENASMIAIAIANKDYSKIPTLENFAVNLLSQVKWTGIEEAELMGARLNDAFLLDFKANVK